MDAETNQHDLPTPPSNPPMTRWLAACTFLAGAATVILLGMSAANASGPREVEISAVASPRLASDIDATVTIEPVGTPVANEAREVYEVRLMEVTAYCPCRKCCGPRAQGITASGLRVDHNGGLFVAADTHVLPFGTRLRVPGYGNTELGEAVEVIDRGGAIRGNKLDVFFPTHREALQWGRQILPVRILGE